MRKIIAALFFLAMLSSCTNKQENIASKYLNPNNLNEQLFTININKDTSLVTQQGLKIKIAANSIEASTPTVTIQVKEALSLEAMLKAGLTTVSDKGILSSDGMFHIATKEESKIVKPLNISLPTTAVNKDMQLYKGQEEDGCIVWSNPEKINTQQNKESTGQNLFMAHCSSCHAIDKRLTGPELAWIENRWSNRDALRAYIKDPGAFMRQPEMKDTSAKDHFAKYRQYANCLFEQYRSSMPNFETVQTNNQIDAIINYINYESKHSGLPEDYKQMDSCFKYQELYMELMYKRDSLVEDNGKMVEITITPPADQDPNSDNGNEGEIPKVARDDFEAEYYQFPIDAYGWYNVDDLFMEKFNSKISELSVSLEGAISDKTNTYLIIPSLKVFIPGGKLDNGKFGFFTVDGKLPLPQGFEAYIIALSESNGKTFFGKKRFITSLSASYTVDIKEMSPEKIMRQMGRLKLDNLDFKVEKTKNFNSLQQVDKELNGIREKVKDCPCMQTKPVEARK